MYLCINLNKKFNLTQINKNGKVESIQTQTHASDLYVGRKLSGKKGICSEYYAYEFVWMSSKIIEQNEQTYMPDPRASVQLVQHTWQTENQCYKQPQLPVI